MKKGMLWLSIVIVSMLMIPGTGICDSITNIQLAAPSYSLVPFGEDVTINFDYNTDTAGGVRIFVRPMTDGAPTPNYGASGSPLYQTGSGSGSGTFNIGSGDVIVDQLEFTMTNDDQSETLLAFNHPVVYVFRASGSTVSNITMTPASPASLAHGKNIMVDFDCENNEPGNILVFARPMTNGADTPDYGASGGATIPQGAGSGTQTFSIDSGDARIDEIKFEIYNADQSALLVDFTIPVDYKVPVIFQDPPMAPVLSMSTAGVEVVLSWTAVPNADAYTLIFAPSPDAEYISSQDMGTRTSTVLTFHSGAPAFYYAVMASNANGLSPLSNILTFPAP